MVLNEGVQRYQARIRQEKKQQILTAAAEILLEKGYDNTSVAEIARHAGVSHATFYKYFPAKSELLAAICDFIIQEPAATISEPIRQGGSVEETLRAIARLYVEMITRPEMQKLFRLIIAEVTRFPELGEIFYTRVKAPVYDQFYAYIREQANAGQLVVEDERHAAATIMSLINQYFMLGPLYTGRTVDQLEAEPTEVVERAIRHFMTLYGSGQR